jgi:hypothetical protein
VRKARLFSRIRAITHEKGEFVRVKILSFWWLLLMIGGASAPPAGAANRITLPSGDKGYSISCVNAATVNACYEEASATCPYGYEIINKEEERGQETRASANAYYASSASSSTWARGLLIQCKQDERVESERIARLKSDAEREAAEKAVSERDGKKGLLFVGAFLVFLFVVLGK